MLLFASLARTDDGMALAASTESGLGTKYLSLLKSAQPYIRLMSKQIPSYPPRCSLCGDGFSIYFQHKGNVCCFAISTNSYSYTLAFSFLQDVLNEFVRVNNAAAVQSAKRAYEYIHFDTYLQKLKARYNGSAIQNRMSSFMAISDNLTEKPPYRIDIDTLDNAVKILLKEERSSKPTIPPTHRYTPLSMLGGIAVLLNSICAILNLIRGMHLINEAGFDVDTDDDSVYIHGLMFFLSTILCFYQIYLLKVFTKFRTAQSFFVLCLLILCHLTTRHHRHPFQLLFHTGVAAFTTFHIHSRQMLAKLPEYNV